MTCIETHNASKISQSLVAAPQGADNQQVRNLNVIPEMLLLKLMKVYWIVMGYSGNFEKHYDHSTLVGIAFYLQHKSWVLLTQVMATYNTSHGYF